MENKRKQKLSLENKALFIAKATAHFDLPRIRKEASDMWDKANGREYTRTARKQEL